MFVRCIRLCTGLMDGAVDVLRRTMDGVYTNGGQRERQLVAFRVCKAVGPDCPTRWPTFGFSIKCDVSMLASFAAHFRFRHSCGNCECEIRCFRETIASSVCLLIEVMQCH